ncbi:hypothetical protein AA11237_3412 [Acidocella aminolytica 101 = DSM 11237]|nr:hypothetical protein AA11237_3412 [Acidocella aminolytica 101 = DSM 11237]
MVMVMVTEFVADSMIIRRQPQKPPCLLGHVPELGQAAAFADQIQHIAMRALGGILLMCNCT